MGEMLLESLRLHLDLGAGEERVCAALSKADRKEKEEFCDRLLLEALLVDALGKKGHESVWQARTARKMFWPVFGVAALLMIVAGLCLLRQSSPPYPLPELRTRSESGRIVTMKAPERGEPVEAGPVAVSLRLGGYCDLSLDPAARLVLRGSPRKEAVEVVEGRVTSRVAPHRGEFTLYTPIGCLIVKGTEFTTIVERTPSSQGKTRSGDAKESATVTAVVVSGVVEYRFGERSGLLQAGQSQVFVGEAPARAPTAPAQRPAPVVATGPAAPAPQGAVGADEAMQLCGQAIEKMRDGDDAGAMVILKQIVSRYPKNTLAGHALRYMGSILMKQQRYDEAIEAFRRGMTVYPDARYANGKLVASFSAYDIATCLYLKGDEDEALAAFEEAAKKYPDATAIDGRLLSDVFLDMVERGGAAPRTGQAGQPPDAARTLYFEGVRRDKQDPEGAMRIFQEVLAKYARSNWAGCALADIGFIFKRQGKYDEAVEILRRAQREYPDSKYGTGKMVAPTAVYNIVHCLGLKGEVAEAKKAFEEAVKMYPTAAAENGKLLRDIFLPPADEGEALYMRAEGVRQNRPEDALKVYQELVSRYPKHRLAGAALTNSARTLYRLGRFDEAVAAVKRVIEEYPDSQFWAGGKCAMSAAYEVGMWYCEKKDMENAKKAFEFALSKYPNASYAKSPSYIKMMKELGVAVEKGSKRASQGPDPGRELYFRALGLGKENPEEGLRTYDELLTQYPQHELAGAALSSQGDLYRLMNQYDKAIAKFQRVLEEYPDSRFTGGDPVAPAAAWLIMMSYYSKNDMPNAKKALDFALQKYPDARFGGRLRSESYAKIIKRINEAAAK